MWPQIGLKEKEPEKGRQKIETNENNITNPREGAMIKSEDVFFFVGCDTQQAHIQRSTGPVP